MKTYRHLITELFDNPYSFNLKRMSDKSSEYEFYTSEQKKYIVFMMNTSEKTDTWDVVFADEKGKLDITGEGKQESIRIFSTVVAVIKDFVKKVSPQKIMFSAYKDEKSRIKLYKSIIKTQIPSGYTGRFENELHATFFYWEKK